MLFDRFKKVALSHQSKIAIVSKNEAISYGSCLSIIENLANHIIQEKNISITICTDKNQYAVLWQLAINKSGNIFTSLDSATPDNRLYDIIAQNGSKYVITSKNRDLSLLNGFNIVISTDNFIIWNTLYSTRYKDVTHIYFSSGSTGRPKGIYLNDNVIPDVVLEQARQINITTDSNFAWLLSPSFDASLSDIYLTLLSGATLHICNFQQNKIKTLKSYFIENKISHSDISPSVLPLLNPSDFPDLQAVIFGGEVGNEKIIKEWAESINMFNAYGPTETTICSSFKKVDEKWTSQNIGKPLPGVIYTISEEGELLISGQHLCIGYNQDELNEQKFFIENGTRFYKTGDIVSKVGDEYIFFGRKDRQFKNNGVLISPEEIEKFILEIGCSEALCKKNPKFSLYYVGNINEKEVRDKLYNNFNKNMIPSIIEKVSELEKNINGKIKL